MADQLAALGSSSHFHGFEDIQSARVAFHAFSTAGTGVIELLKAAPELPDYQVWECPMVDQAIPDAPKRGRWLQTDGRPGYNPFFGEEMLECAKQVRP